MGKKAAQTWRWHRPPPELEECGAMLGWVSPRLGLASPPALMKPQPDRIDHMIGL